MKKIAIIGFGRAGHFEAQTLRNNGYKDDITVFTEYRTGVDLRLNTGISGIRENRSEGSKEGFEAERTEAVERI